MGMVNVQNVLGKYPNMSNLLPLLNYSLNTDNCREPFNETLDIIDVVFVS